ncbi:hypothetical protein RHMOL_Rhmol05G0030000 [Rhododendron molle]|uniref:Uncharacterized protein n=1 Tax=Rhododendron molle TaxID=49168 RepID=A0ACC0NKS8_RHOML|nr:hypothetical protein RHMOL_Rhmol05G0030000 [Rhododendron molle]
MILKKDPRYVFSDDVETLQFDEEDMGEDAIVSEDKEIDGIPVGNFPKSLVRLELGGGRGKAAVITLRKEREREEEAVL